MPASTTEQPVELFTVRRLIDDEVLYLSVRLSEAGAFADGWNGAGCDCSQAAAVFSQAITGLSPAVLEGGAN